LALILNDLKRFWWISALYALLLFLASPLMLLNRDLEHYVMHELTIYLNSVLGGALFFLVLMPVAIGVMVFRYIQNSKSVTVIHSMPYTRLQLYVNHFLSGLILMLVPILLNGVILWGISSFTGYGLVMEENLVSNWLQIQLWVSIALYAVTVAIGMFTGSSIAQIIFTYIYNFLALGFLYGTGAIFQGQVYGFNGFSEEVAMNIAKFFPITQLIVVDNEDLLMKDLALINIVMFVIVGAIGYFVYRYRNLEDAGDVISNKILKPIFKYGVTVCVMITGIVYVKGILDLESPNFLIYLLFALIGYVIAEMLLRKSFKVWNSYKGFIGFIGAFAIVVLLLHFDVFGYERYIPETAEIEKAFVSDSTMNVKSFIEGEYSRSWGIGVLSEAENIELVRDLHQKIVEDRLAEDSGTYGFISVAYLLKNGKIVERSYMNNIQDYEAEIEKIQATREFRNSTNEIFSLTTKQLKSIDVSNQITGKMQSLTDPAVMQQIFMAAQEAVYQSKDAQFRNYGSRYCVEFVYEFDDEDRKETVQVYTTKYEMIDETYYRSVRLYFDDEDTVLKEALINAGCGELFTDYMNVEKIRMKPVDNLNQEGRMITDPDKVQAFVARIGELNDFQQDTDVYRVEFYCNSNGSDEEYVGTRVNIRLYADERFEEFYR